AGAHPIFLPPVPELAPDHARRCHAIVFSGGDDPRMEDFGEPTHPSARPVDPQRQRYELQLLTELERNHPETPVLGVCLGMQYMALHAGGRLNQHMPDDIPTHETHRDDKPHNVRPIVENAPIPAGIVTSHHRQAVTDPGRLRTIAIAEDNIIEAIDDPNRSFYIGVQWHPERTSTHAVGQAIYDKLIQAISR
ncbi:MAG: hypothetical protein EA376_11690, partial [Phycisphaeraceae bacterium]